MASPFGPWSPVGPDVPADNPWIPAWLKPKGKPKGLSLAVVVLGALAALGGATVDAHAVDVRYCAGELHDPAFNVTSIEIAPWPAQAGAPLNLTLHASTGLNLTEGIVMLKGDARVSPWAPPVPLLWDFFDLCDIAGAPAGSKNCSIAAGEFGGMATSKPLRASLPGEDFAVTMSILTKTEGIVPGPETCLTFAMPMKAEAPKPAPVLAAAERKARWFLRKARSFAEA